MAKTGAKSQVVQSAQKEARRADFGEIYRLAYVSEVSEGFGPEDLADIEMKSRVCNAEDDITGILIVEDGMVLQVLEGGKKAVNALFSRIQADPRHQFVKQVAGSAQDQRLLSCWSLVGGRGEATPSELKKKLIELNQRWRAHDGFLEVSADEVELLKVVALFRSLPKMAK